MKKLLISAIAMFACDLSQAQTISSAANAPRSGDNYQLKQVQFFPPGDEGENVVWDFSNLDPYDTDINREFFWGQDSMLIRTEQEQLTKYVLKEDSLLCMGYENRLTSMSFSKPMVMMTYPYSYGNSISNPYEGIGDYCKRLILKNGGTLIVEADAKGTIINHEGDSIKNVIRVHTTRLNSVSMHALSDTLLVDDSRMKQEIEDHYAWYVRGYRYPMYETSSISFYDNMQPVSCIQKAYYYDNEGIALVKDEANEKIQKEDILAQNMNVDIIKYEFHKTASSITLDYSLDQNANILALICNSRGILFGRNSTRQAAGTGYQMKFDIAHLPKGEYILYINVNGKIYNEKFFVK